VLYPSVGYLYCTLLYEIYVVPICMTSVMYHQFDICTAPPSVGCLCCTYISVCLYSIVCIQPVSERISPNLLSASFIFSSSFSGVLSYLFPYQAPVSYPFSFVLSPYIFFTLMSTYCTYLLLYLLILSFTYLSIRTFYSSTSFSGSICCVYGDSTRRSSPEPRHIFLSIITQGKFRVDSVKSHMSVT
jgi:hypothetical protein